MRFNSKAIQRAIFDTVFVHKFAICGHGFFALVACFIKTGTRKKKNESANDQLG
jgi:hypothetical protein